MLVRTQVLLDDKDKLELQELLQYFPEISFSEAIREGHSMIVKKMRTKRKKNKTKKKSGIEFLDYLAKNAVEGPGDSEYDKYAYDY